MFSKATLDTGKPSNSPLPPPPPPSVQPARLNTQPVPQLITSRIVSARSVDELQRVVEASNQDLNRIHAAAALVRLAKLCSPFPCSSIGTRSSSSSPAPGRGSSQAPLYSSSSGSGSGSSEGSEQQAHQDASSSGFGNRTSLRVPGLQDLSASAGDEDMQHTDQLASAASHQVQALASSLEHRFAHSTQRLPTIRQHANVCWALGRLGHQPSLKLKRSLRRRLAQYSQPARDHPPSRIGQEVANLAHGLARLGLIDPSVWQAVCQVVGLHVQRCRPMELAHLGWALARMIEATEEQLRQLPALALGAAAGSSSIPGSAVPNGHSPAGGAYDHLAPTHAAGPPAKLQPAAGTAPRPLLRPQHPAATSPSSSSSSARQGLCPPTGTSSPTPGSLALDAPASPLQGQSLGPVLASTPVLDAYPSALSKMSPVIPGLWATQLDAQLKRPQHPLMQQQQQQQHHQQQGEQQQELPEHHLPTQVLHPPPQPAVMHDGPAAAQLPPQPHAASNAPHVPASPAQHAFWFPPPPHRPSRRPLQRPIVRPQSAPPSQQQPLQPPPAPVVPLHPSPIPSHATLPHHDPQQEQQQQQPVRMSPWPPPSPAPLSRAQLQQQQQGRAARSPAWCSQYDQLRASLQAALGRVAEAAQAQLAQVGFGWGWHAHVCMHCVCE